MECDFQGYATKANLKCTDGRTIMPDAFKHQDKMRVPLVWQHGHADPENVLGHAILENREDGMYAYGFFNKSSKAAHAGELLTHQDIRQMSIWANDLIERSGRVIHGAIREVSLVLSGANPGALIESVTIRHSDGDESILDDEAIITTGLDLSIAHADGEDPDEGEDEDETIQDVYESMSEKQKTVLHYMIGEAIAAEAESTKTVKQDNMSDNTDQEGEEMSNVFEKDPDGADPAKTLSHDDMKAIVADATRTGSLREAVENYALSHGIEDIEVLFPEARALTTTPEWESRRMEWVSGVLSGTTKSPFSRVKTWTADITYEEARAKGYVKGSMKKEEYFSISRRTTTPTTIYKKQKLDRDDIVDITDFDVVMWMKGEMRVMLDEEIARAILIGDGRDVADEDKVNAEHIRPILTDDPFYVRSFGVNLADSNSSVMEAIDSIIANRRWYKGSGLPTLYTTEAFISDCLVLRDKDGRRMYRTLDELATELRVAAIVPVEVMESEPTIIGILVNLRDYVIGADRGGQVAMFDDFDIDYNQYKYLIETRMSGALTKPSAAQVFYRTASTDVAVQPPAPTYNSTTFKVTIPDVIGAEYVDQNGDVLPAGDITLDPGEVLRVTAAPEDGYYIAKGLAGQWSFLRPSA